MILNFDCVNLLHYKCHKRNRGGSYIDSPDWIKNRKATINLVNVDDQWFQSTATVALSPEKIGKNSQRISKTETFMYKCNWKGINSSSKKRRLERI